MESSGWRAPASGGLGSAIVGDDQVEVEHQPVELLLPQARTVEQHRSRRFAILGRNGRCQSRDPWIDRRLQFRRNQRAKLVQCSASGGDSDEGQRLRQLEEDRTADLGAEGLAIKDDLGAFALDADLVAFLEMDSAELRMAKFAGQGREECPEQRRRPLLDRNQSQRPLGAAAKLTR